MSTITSSLTGNSLIAYLQTATAKAQSGTGEVGDAAASRKTAATNSVASNSAVLAASHGYRSTVAQGSLDRQQNTLAADLRKALGKTGIELSGPVKFGVSSAGKLVVSGSDADKEKISKFLSGDTTKPSFSTQLIGLTSAAENLSNTIKQSAAISQAARYSSGPAGLLAIYATLSKQQDSAAALFTLSGASSSLTYAGVLTSKA